MDYSVGTHIHQSNEEVDQDFAYAVQLAHSAALPMALHTAIELGIFETLADAGTNSKLSASEITAKMLNVNNADAPMMLDRILRLLVSYKVIGCSLNETVRQYFLTPVSKYFVPNKDGVSLGPYMLLTQDKVLSDSWTKMKDTVLEGGSPFKNFYGINIYEKASMDPRLNKLFNSGMFHFTNLVVGKLLETYNGFEQLNQLIDVGGGLGHTLKAITTKYTNLKGINFDLPHVIQQAPQISEVEHIGGDMFESVPKGEAIFMKWILHNWSDEYCLKLLKNCYGALSDDGKVIVMESVLPIMPVSTTLARANFLIDLFMMCRLEGGIERTENEFLALATAAGFRGIRYICRVCNFWIMEFFK